MIRGRGAEEEAYDNKYLKVGACGRRHTGNIHDAALIFSSLIKADIPAQAQGMDHELLAAMPSIMGAVIHQHGGAALIDSCVRWLRVDRVRWLLCELIVAQRVFTTDNVPSK